MQLHLEMDELNLLANILMERAGRLSGAVEPATANSKRTEQELRSCNAVLDKVLARDLELDSDELQQLADLLTEAKRALDEQAAHRPEGEHRDRSDDRRLLARLTEKIDECCVMF